MNRVPDHSRKDSVLFVPLGGCEEIGMNLNLYGQNGKWLMVDLGVNFGEENVPGIDLTMPDIDFIEAQRDNLVGLVLTHAHEDHFGAVAYLWPRLRCPVYATPFTAALLRRKLGETGLQGDVPLHEVELGGAVELDPFRVTFVTLTHSILEPNALAIETAAGTILHTGDWKIDPDPQIGETTDETMLRRLGEEGVTAMVCDSTNVFVPGRSGSEADVRVHLIDLIKQCPHRVAMTTFASNLARIQTMVEAGKADGREVALVGRSLYRAVEAAVEAGYLKDLPRLLSPEDAAHLPREKTMYILTGSQGEPRGALARVARGEHRDVVLEAGDTVIFSSKIIPGNEKTLSAIYNMLAEQDIETITEDDYLVHVSGHPCRDELAQMYQWVRPKIAIPVHGEQRHLREHAKLAHDLQVPRTVRPRNGAVFEISADGEISETGAVEAGMLALDGHIIVPVDADSIRERRKLLFDGYLNATVVLNQDGSFYLPPRFHWEGLPLPRDERKIRRAFEDALVEAMQTLPKRDRGDDDRAGEMMRRALRRAARDLSGKNPPTRIELLRID